MNNVASETRCRDCQTWTSNVLSHCDRCIEKHKAVGGWCEKHGPTFGRCLAVECGGHVGTYSHAVAAERITPAQRVSLEMARDIAEIERAMAKPRRRKPVFGPYKVRIAR